MNENAGIIEYFNGVNKLMCNLNSINLQRQLYKIKKSNIIIVVQPYIMMWAQDVVKRLICSFKSVDNDKGFQFYKWPSDLVRSMVVTFFL